MAYFPQDLTPLTFRQFAGSAQSADPYDIDISHGLYTQNVDFVVSPDGTAIQTRSRFGVSQVAQIPNGDGAVTAMANWYYTNAGMQTGLVIYYAPALGVKSYSQGGVSFSGTRVSVTGAASATFAFNAVYAYVGFTNTSGQASSSGGYVLNDQTNAADEILTAPPARSNITVFSGATAGTGVVTAGPHTFALLITSRSGQPILGPVSSITNGVATLSPELITAADGTHALLITVTFTGGIPSSLQGQPVQIVMTTASNQSRYYAVPGATTTMPFGSSGTISATVNITDGDLTATATDVTFYQNLLTQDLSGNPPFKPYSLFTYSSRMGYCAYDLSGFPVVYFSDQNSFQSLTAAFHGIYLEGRQIVVTGVSLGAVCYLATLSGLYSTQDNGGYPGTWTPPMRVDGSTGVLAPSNMLVSGGRINVASEKGLYFYRGGSFPEIPVSYWQSNDWNRINWAAPTQVQVIDDQTRRTLRVIAPLKVVVTAASNTNPITITTAVTINGRPIAYPHLFQTGLSVTITGVGGNTAANTTATITVTGANTFTIPVAGNGAYTSGGVVTPNSSNAEMSWNYSKGESPGELMYSLNAFASYRMGTAGVIRNITNNLDEVWYMPGGSNPGGMVRQAQPVDASPNQDVNMSGSAAAIASDNETGLCPQVGGEEPSATLHDFHGMHMRVTGSGNLAVTAYSLDHTTALVPARSPLALNPTDGQEELVKWFLRNEQQSVSWGTNAVGAWWLIAMVKQYFKPSVPFR